MNSSSPSRNGDSWVAAVLERGLLALDRLPSWLVPPVVGAAIAFVVTAMRGLLLLFTMPADPASVLTFTLALVASTLAGAVAGCVYWPVRWLLGNLGSFGDLVTGAAVGSSYILAILVPAKYLFGDDILGTRGSWLVACAMGAGFGVICTLLYWYYRHRLR